MRKIITLLVFAIFLTSFVSAGISFFKIQQQPNEIYNLGETVSTSVKIQSTEEATPIINSELLCGESKQIGQIPIFLNTQNGYQQIVPIIIPVKKSFIGELKGNCQIRISILDETPILTNEFLISDFINIEFPFEKTEFKPEEKINIKGKATKESGELVKNGFIEVSIVNDIQTVKTVDTVTNGYFSVNLSLPKEIPAGPYLTKVRIYEEEKGEITNNGFIDYNIKILQIPTNLEIVFENQEVEPGTNLKVKTILHDQSGEPIESLSIITVKNSENIILEQVEKQTGEILEYPIIYKESPATWKIFAVSNQLTQEANFKIIEKEEVNAELINRTLIVTNIGNIPYNDTLSVKIGEKIVNLDLFLQIDEIQKYVLSAPDGEYQVEVKSPTGESKATGNVMLTGNAIDIRKAAEGMGTLVRHPFVWIFVMLILGFMAFIVYKKGYQKSFVGYIKKIKSKTIKKDEEEIPAKEELVNSKNKAELSLSIKGEKQNASLVCVNIKNIDSIKMKKDGAKEPLQEIIDVAEKNKASTYENQGNFFFLLAPINTRTFKNERDALNIAQEIEQILDEYNRTAAQKIDFGISINYGTIVAKKDNNNLKFMSMGTLITGAKKIATLANNEILMGEKIKEKLMTDVKSEKQIRENTQVFVIKEIKKEKEENKKFIGNFVRRMEKEKK